MTAAAKRALPALVLGAANLPLGVTGGWALLTVPQILAARHVPEPVIAGLTTMGLVPTFAVFIVGPVLDTRFSRKTYAVAATLLSAGAMAVSVIAQSNLLILALALFASVTGAAINNVAVGGWFGSIVPKEKEAVLGAAFTAANTLGFGLFAIVGIQLFRGLPTPLAAAALSAPVLLPLLVYAATPATQPDARLAKETFNRFLGDLAALVRQPTIVRLLLMFALPSSAFALTNTLGGLGRDYHADETFVAVIGGVAVTLAGLFGTAITPPLVRWFPSPAVYLGVGAAGALFTLSLIVLPKTPLIFATAMVGENIAQSVAIATSVVIALESLGENNPFAATQYGLLNCMAALPIVYMQLVDGTAYGRGGLGAMYAADAGLGLAACVLVAVLLRSFLLTRPKAESVI